ncbi:MAG: ABC-type amino acid transport substrate-binding protein [Oceanospirillaceae bacterium]|jgi:ABC-type amino acid transport substrate-binding protein
MLVSKTTKNYHKMISLDDVTSGEKFSYIGINGDNSTEEFYKKYGLSFGPVDTVAQAVQMLAAGRVDAFVHFKANGLLKINQNNLQDKVELHPKQYDPVDFNLLISESYEPRDEVLNRVDQLIKQMKASGEFQPLLDRIIIEEVNRIIESGSL